MATSARNWKKPQLTELELPSGNTCLVKRPGMESLIASGALPDSLTPIAMEAIQKSQRAVPQDHKPKKGEEVNELDPELFKKFMENPNALNDIFESFDRVTAMVVMEPAVMWHKREKRNSAGDPELDTEGRTVMEVIPQEDRKEDILYTDDVDGKDKEFIFNFSVGGSSDLESFRKERGDDVAALQSGDDVPVPSE